MQSEIDPFSTQAPKFDLTAAQESLLFLSQAALPHNVYLISFAIMARGRLDEGRLVESVNLAVAKHPALRTIIIEDSGRFRQCVMPRADLEIARLRMEASTTEEMRSAAMKIAIEQGGGISLLVGKPLMRAACLKVCEDFHCLVFTFHHIIFDARSSFILFDDIVAAYSNREHFLSFPPIGDSFFEKLVRQQQDKEPAYASLDTLMMAKFENSLNRYPLPNLWRSNHHYDGSCLMTELSAESMNALGYLCRQQGMTPFMVLLSVTYAVLYSCNFQHETVVGAPVSLRRSEAAGVIGCYLNMLPLRLDWTSITLVKDLLFRCKYIILEALRHYDYPLERTLRNLRERKGLHQSSQLQFILSFNSKAEKVRRNAGIEFELLDLPDQTAEFDLGIEANYSENACDLKFRFKSALFSQETIQLLARCFDHCLQIMAHAQETSFNELSRMLTQHLIPPKAPAFSQPKLHFVSMPCVLDRLQLHSTQIPDKPAILCDGNSISYREFYHRATHLAHKLAASGFRPGMIAAIHAQMNPQSYVALYAVLLAGGAFLNINSGSSSGRIKEIFATAKPALLLLDSTDMESFDFLDCPKVTLDPPCSVEDTMALLEGEPPGSGSLAYLAFTSGSSGSPKGVMVPYDAFCRRIDSLRQCYGFNSKSRLLAFLPLVFDAALEEIFPLFAAGGTLIIAPNIPERSFSEALDLISKWEINTLHIPPAYAHDLLDFCIASGRFPSCVQTLISGGEKFSIIKAFNWLQNGHSNKVFINAYGPTETIITSSCFTICTEDIKTCPSYAQLPVGKPLYDAAIYLLDKNLNPVQPGFSGEIFIGGECMGWGYWKDAKATAASFLPDPFSTIAGARMYATRDRGVLLPSGDIQMIDRMDNQVKLRGHRIELEDIERNLNMHPAVQSCAVTVRTFQGSENLVAFVKLNVASLRKKGEEVPAVSSLQGYLRNRLPEYMVPIRMIYLDEIPLTHSGKIDRLRLKTWDLQVDSGDLRTVVHPRNKIEMIVSRIWKEVLGLQEISMHDNFFEVGGYSLVAMRLVSILENTLKLNVSLKLLFENPTPELLAMALTEMKISSSSKKPDSGTVPLNEDQTSSSQANVS